MDKKPRQIISGSYRLPFIVLVLFAVAAAVIGRYELALAEAAVIAVLTVAVLISSKRRQKELSEYIESMTYDADNAKTSTLKNFPLPAAVFRLKDTGIVWGNESFFEMSGETGKRMDAKISDMFPEFNAKWLLDGRSQYHNLLENGGRKYRVHGSIVRAEKDTAEDAFMGVTYWMDVTDYENLNEEYMESRPAVGIIVIDNLDELYKNQPERIRNDIRDSIEEKLGQWAEESHGIFLRYDRDRYITVFEKRYTDRFREDKFAIVKEIHSIENPLGIDASISIGLGEEADSFTEALRFANAALELAISRGGDQTVIKNKHGFGFFGGRGSEVEKRTNVKSRVVANTFAEFMRDSSGIMVMGHKYSDLDCIGAAAGVCCMARKLGVKYNIVVNRSTTVSEPLIQRLRETEEYKSIFITPSEAMYRADSGTLLVLVDTSRPEQTEDEDLLQSCNRVVVIDHHRVAATYVQDAALTFIEPYASSASELAAELLQEIVERADILPAEAEALLAGMVLDTKNFTIRTGDRTFEAAAYLRRAGANTVEVKKLLQSDLNTTVSKYNILTQARLYKNIAIAVPEEPQTRIIAAQAADELLNISGVEASIVLAPDGKGGSFASARSIGQVNVQILMEKLGGGGNRSVAAVQFKDTDTSEAEQKILAAIDEYFTE